MYFPSVFIHHSLIFRTAPKLDSKNQFIASAVADQNNPLITRATTLLIDDDFNNIDNALTHNIRALHFDPTNPHLIIADILELI